MTYKEKPNNPVRFRAVPSRWVDDPRIRYLADYAFRVYWHALTGPQMGALGGLCRLGPGSVADTWGWEYKHAVEALLELQEAGLIVYDREAMLLYIPGICSYLPPPNPNSLTSAMTDLNSMPATEVKGRYVAELMPALRGKPWVKLEVLEHLTSMLPPAAVASTEPLIPTPPAIRSAADLSIGRADGSDDSSGNGSDNGSDNGCCGGCGNGCCGGSCGGSRSGSSVDCGSVGESDTPKRNECKKNRDNPECTPAAKHGLPDWQSSLPVTVLKGGKP